MLLVITHPEHLPGETLRWQQLLSAGADAILLRKPGWREDDYAHALEQTDPSCYPRLIVAQHQALCHRFGLLGVHFSESLRNSTPPEQLATLRRRGCMISTGIHTVAGLPQLAAQWDLLLLSPVFDSISKPGYQGRFGPEFRLPYSGAGARILALGGVDHTNAAQAQQMGFDGIALLGAIWKDPEKALDNFVHIKQLWNANAHTS